MRILAAALAGPSPAPAWRNRIPRSRCGWWLGNATVRQRLVNGGAEPLDMSAQDAKSVRSEIEDYARVVRAAGIKPQ